MSSCHLLLGLPLDAFQCLTCHSVHFTFNLSSFMRATCPAHFHFALVITFKVSSTSALSLLVEFGILSIYFRPNIFHFYLTSFYLLEDIFSKWSFLRAVCHFWTRTMIKDFSFQTNWYINVLKYFFVFAENSPSSLGS